MLGEQSSIATPLRVFGGKFLDALDHAHRSDRIPDDPQGPPAALNARRRALLKHDWVVYANPPPGGPAQVLDYLARYTHRVPISNERIIGSDHEHVRLRAGDNRTGGKRTVVLSAEEFIARFLRHMLPQGFKRIRHYGLLAPAHKRERLATARAALQTPEPHPAAIEAAEALLARVSGHDPQLCPHCQHGHWRTVATLPPLKHEADAPAPRCRDGPQP